MKHLVVTVGILWGAAWGPAVGQDLGAIMADAHKARLARETDRSAALWQQGIQRAQELKDAAKEAKCWSDGAWTLQEGGRISDAVDWLRHALAIHEQTGDKVQQAVAHMHLGWMHEFVGKLDESLTERQTAARLFQSAGDRGGEAWAEGSVAAIWARRGQYEEALAVFPRAAAVLQEVGRESMAFYCLNNMGCAYAETGRFGQARETFEKALVLAEKYKIGWSLPEALNNLGCISYQMADYDRALDYFLRAADKGGTTAIAAHATLNSGALYHLIGDFNNARLAFQKALELTRQSGERPVEIGALCNLGSVLVELGRVDEAVSTYSQALQLARELKLPEGQAVALEQMGLLHLRQGALAQAEEVLRQALKLSEARGLPPDTAPTLCGLASVCRSLKRYDESVAFAAQAVKVAGDDASQSFSAWLAQGDSLVACGELGQAQQCYEAAMAASEHIQAGTGDPSTAAMLGANRSSAYARSAGVLVQLNQPEEAFAAAERGKGRALLSILENGGLRSTRGMTDEERVAEQALIDQLSYMNRTVASGADEAATRDTVHKRDAVRLQLRDFQTSLLARHPELALRRGRSQPVTTAQLASRLDAQTALLEYVVDDEQTVLMLIRVGAGSTRPARLRCWRLPCGAAELAAAVAELRSLISLTKSVGPKPPAGYVAAAQGLYRQLLQPCVEDLKGISRLIIVPDGPLSELPFQALMRDDSYLVNCWELAYAPSATLLGGVTAPPNPQPRPREIMICANPDFGSRTWRPASLREGLAPLPGADDEGKAIQQLFGATATLLSGAQATESALKQGAGDCRILHLATHGLIDSVNPLYSAIALARPEGDARDDGFWEAWEVAGADLPADLVFLSACQTARGRIVGGEGMMGLTWALRCAGVRKIVATQWSVADASTTTLATNFYKRLRRGEAPGSALRNAQRDLLRDPRHAAPFYWAPFILIG